MTRASAFLLLVLVACNGPRDATVCAAASASPVVEGSLPVSVPLPGNSAPLAFSVSVAPSDTCFGQPIGLELEVIGPDNQLLTSSVAPESIDPILSTAVEMTFTPSMAGRHHVTLRLSNGHLLQWDMHVLSGVWTYQTRWTDAPLWDVPFLCFGDVEMLSTGALKCGQHLIRADGGTSDLPSARGDADNEFVWTVDDDGVARSRDVGNSVQAIRGGLGPEGDSDGGFCLDPDFSILSATASELLVVSMPSSNPGCDQARYFVVRFTVENETISPAGAVVTGAQVGLLTLVRREGAAYWVESGGLTSPSFRICAVLPSGAPGLQDCHFHLGTPVFQDGQVVWATHDDGAFLEALDVKTGNTLAELTLPAAWNLSQTFPVVETGAGRLRMVPRVDGGSVEFDGFPETADSWVLNANESFIWAQRDGGTRVWAR